MAGIEMGQHVAASASFRLLPFEQPERSKRGTSYRS
jgi:hypothetical protein